MEKVLLTLTRSQLDKVKNLAQEEQIPLEQIDSPELEEGNARISRLVNALEEVGSMLVQAIKDQNSASDDAKS
jgi:hypothetical protein